MINAHDYIDKWVNKNGPFDGYGKQYEDGDMIDFAEDYAEQVLKVLCSLVDFDEWLDTSDPKIIHEIVKQTHD